MYGRGNYTAPMGHGPYPSTPPFHQHPPAPQLPPPPPISQSPHPPLPAMIQQGLPPIPPHVGQLGRPVYPHALPGLPQQGPPNPVLLSATNNQSNATSVPPPPAPQPLKVQGTSQVQQHSHWTCNAPFIQPTGLPLAPRVLPPPHSRGQTMFSNQVHQPAAGSMQATMQPHPQGSNFYTSPPVGSFEHSMPFSSNDPVGPLPPPPPLPSSLPGSPPLPPSSPPPTSCSPFSKNHLAIPIPPAAESGFHPRVSSRVSKSSGLEVSASGTVGGVSDPSLVFNDICDGEAGSEIVSAHGENLTSHLHPPPPKPTDDRTVRSIELLCQFIAKNGPEFENMTRLKEIENPKFKFLFGGEPGSEAAVAHEYFIWRKRTYHLEFSSVEEPGRHTSPFRQSERLKTNGGAPCSPSDSDMDMEDDITHPDEEPRSVLSEKQSHDIISVSNGLDKKQVLQPLLHIAEPNLAKDAADRNLVYSQHSESLGSREQRQGTEMSSDQDESIIRKSFAEVDALDTHASGVVRFPSTVNKISAPHEGLHQPSGSAESAEIRLEKLPDLLVKQSASPFRLLQDYVSGESSGDEGRHVDVVPTTFVPPVEVGSTSLDTDEAVDLNADLVTEGVLESDKGLERLRQSFKSQSSSAKSESVLLEADMTSVTGKSEDFFYGNRETLKDVTPQGKPQLSKDDGIGPVGNIEKKKDPKSMSSMSKVDEFGRLIREGDSDSDSVRSPRSNRRKRGRSRTRSRTRSRSRSRSSHDRRRWRSPRRRNERRGRSRSLSPKRLRSRSRSPPSRHGGDTMRRDKGQRSECFDFVKGKCYRGASCRYLHHEEKTDKARSYRSRQQDLPRSSRTSDVHDKFGTPYRKFTHEINGGRTQQLKPLDDLSITEEKKDMKEAMDAATTHFRDKSGHLEPLVHLMTDANVEMSPGDAAYGRFLANENSDLQQSWGHFSDRFHDAGHQHQQIDTNPGLEPAPMHTPAILSQLNTDKTYLNDEAASQSRAISHPMNKTFQSESISSQSMAPKLSVPPVADHLSDSLPLFPAVSQDTSSSFNQEMPKDNNLTSPAAKFPSFTAPVENFPPYQASVSYSHTQFPFPPNPSWNSLAAPPVQPHPPRPTVVNDMISTPGLHSGAAIHVVQNMLTQRNDFYSQTSARPYLTELPPPPNVGQDQGYPPLQEPNRPPDHLDDLQPRTIAMSQTISSQPHGGPGLAREDHYARRPGPGVYPSSSYGQESLHTQPMPFSGDSLSKRIQSFPDENLPPADGVSAVHGEHVKHSSSLPRYTSVLDRNQPHISSDFGISRISNHFNPYASTFEQPLSSKFGSNILVQEKDKPFNSALGAALSHVPVEGRAVASFGSLQAVEGVLPQPGNDQYDPLQDSIEPSLNSVRRSHHGQKHEITDESDNMLSFSVSNKLLDTEEKKQKGSGNSEVSGSLENEEYGETADAEVGAVENGSPSNPVDAVDTGAGEDEIDQVKTPGKSKKSKESRSMKLFKVAIANFVKEVLKPSWRQGSMSKEAFKTIVKKTVDRVSGAMQSHQIPKSQAKINHYIDSSQRKLTKLVMGYVDKYVKV